MILGPIVNAELIRVARQRRWYGFRVLVGLILLGAIYQAYTWSVMGNSTIRSSRMLNQWDLSWFANRMVTYFMLGQALAVVCLAPTLVAGAIAEDKQRKTLHYLLSSRLSSLEIVLGKLASRLILVAMPMALGVPVCVMLLMIGGLDTGLIVAIYAATCSVALFEASIAILVSTLCRRGRDALTLTILLTLLWIFGPRMLASVIPLQPEPWPERYERWIEPINTWLIASGPAALVHPKVSAGGFPAIFRAVRTMVGLQLLGSVVLVFLAAWQLRPAFRRQDGAPTLGIRLASRNRDGGRRWWSRPPCGDNAMRWKETHGVPGAGLLLLVTLIAIVTIVLIGYETLQEMVPAAWSDLRAHGYGLGPDTARETINVVLRAMATALFSVTALLMAALAATSISREREDDTWVCLLSTPLSSREILGAKLHGAVWTVRPLLAAIALAWAFGLVVGAFHPLGVLISCVQLGGFVLFVMALGAAASLAAKSTMRAIGLTYGLLLLLSVIIPLGLTMFNGGRPWAGATSPPFLFSMGMLSYPNVEAILFQTARPAATEAELWLPRAVRATTMGTAAYLAAGPILLALAAWRFDRLLDRPRRPVKRGWPASLATRPPASPATAARAGLPVGRA